MHAIILAAGESSRLRPLTADRPKCMVEVGGREMLDRTLSALSSVGVDEVFLVSGYCRERLREAYGDSRHGMSLRWLENPIYDRTNNLYSLWLAREHMTQDYLLLESDVVFEPELLQRLVDSPFENAALVDRYRPELDGTIVKARDDGAVEAMVLKADQGPGFDHSDSLKTVNFYRFGGDFMREHYLPLIDRYVSEKRTDVYYEAVLAELVGEGKVTLGAVLAEGCRWAEVDTPDDHALAEQKFPA